MKTIRLTCKLPDIHLLQDLGHLAIRSIALAGWGKSLSDRKLDPEFLLDPSEQWVPVLLLHLDKRTRLIFLETVCQGSEQLVHRADLPDRVRLQVGKKSLDDTLTYLGVSQTIDSS